MGAKWTDTKAFTHPGVVTRINGQSVTVKLEGNIHCQSCSARGACGISDSPSREVDLHDPSGTFRLNEEVSVVLKRELGRKAVFWAYILPFLVMVLTLLAASYFYPEWLAGTLSLLVLIPYYLLVHALKGYFRKTFRIDVLKI